MTEKEKLIDAIRVLRECLRFDHTQLAITCSQADRAEIWQHINGCIEEFKSLLERIDR
jgi:hypothetical protein